MALPPESLAFLERLLNTPSPSGFETQAQNLIREYMAPLAEKQNRDVHGNQWFVLNSSAPLRVMLAGHVDEIGLMVRYIDEQGFLWVTAIGGPDPLQLWGRRVIVHTRQGPVHGVIGKRPPHHTPPEERAKGAKLEDLFVDIGAKDREAAKKRVRSGDPILLAEGFLRMDEDLIVARGLDDRLGAFVVMEAFRKVRRALDQSRRALACALYAVGSVQEEVGLRGAKTSAFAIDPHVGIAVDVGFATDYPTENKKLAGDFYLGGGPILHRGPNINPVLAELMEQLAGKKRIPYQLNGAGGITGTDAGSIQVNARGVATALLSIPNRYMHSPVEMASLRDVEHCAQLLAETIFALKPELSFVPQ